jgi:hypothetical protein
MNVGYMLLPPAVVGVKLPAIWSEFSVSTAKERERPHLFRERQHCSWLLPFCDRLREDHDCVCSISFVDTLVECSNRDFVDLFGCRKQKSDL